MKELPKFKRQGRNAVVHFVTQVFTHPNQPEISYFRQLIEHEDGHYAVVFSLDYFANTEIPTKSQWNSLKKKLKRHNRQVFVFKAQQIVLCGDKTSEQRCGQVEFGYLAL